MPATPITDGPLPKHQQLRQILLQLIEAELGPGSPIPSERSLMASYEVSRMTVRATIGALVHEGVLERSHGKGTFVAHSRVESSLHLASFTQDMHQRGHRPSSAVLLLEREHPPAPVAEALRLQPHDGDGQRPRAWRLHRLRMADNLPMAYEESWYPEPLTPGLDRQELTASVYRTLREHYGITIDAAEQVLWAESAGVDHARLLGLKPADPLLAFRRTSSTGGVPVEHTVSWYRADRYQLSMRLGGHPAPALHPSENTGGTS